MFRKALCTFGLVTCLAAPAFAGQALSDKAMDGVTAGGGGWLTPEAMATAFGTASAYGKETIAFTLTATNAIAGHSAVAQSESQSQALGYSH